MQIEIRHGLLRVTRFSTLLVFSAVFAAPSQASTFDVALKKNTYLPGEPLDVTCQWPAEAPEESGLIRFRQINLAQVEVTPKTNISYSGKFNNPNCLQLRTPWAPGKYLLEFQADTTPATPARRKSFVVTELPRARILSYVGVKTAAEAGQMSAGPYFQYDLTFTDDRCYQNSYFDLKQRRPVFVIAIERNTGEVARRWDATLMSRKQECLHDCAAAPIPYFCRKSGTYRRALKTPLTAGEWDIALVQQPAPGQVCDEPCVAWPATERRLASKLRVIDRVEAAGPVAVSRMFVSRSNRGDDIIDMKQRLTGSFYLWVEFAERNPFQRELVSATLEDGSELDSILVQRSGDAEGVYYRSERLTPGNFRPKSDDQE